MQQWEYARLVWERQVATVTYVADESIETFDSQERALAHLGKQGWELVSYVVPRKTVYRQDIYVFKRPVQES